MKKLLKKIANLPALKTDRKLIVLLSDDWGSVRIKSLEDQKQLVEKGFKIQSRFDKYDTLESNADIEALFEVLLKHTDHKGNHPVITAVTNVANPDFKRIQENDFQSYYYETIEQTYQRYPESDKVFDLIHQGIRQNIFVPQSHGREHVQVNWWLEELQDGTSFARKTFDNEFFFLGAQYLQKSRRGRDLAAAYDVMNTNDVQMSKESVKSALKIFSDLFNFKSQAFVPPAMYYNTAIEETLFSAGVTWLDVGRFLKVPLEGGSERYQFNYLGKQRKSGLKILVRNSVFETNMSENDNGVDRCMIDIEQAFLNGQPALISNHRASFVGGLDIRNRSKGIMALDELFSRITSKWGDVEFGSAEQLNTL